MEHPKKAQRDNQAAMLAAAPAEQKEYLKLLFSTGNAAYIYHTETRETVIPTEADFNDWLAGLPDNVRKEMEVKGFEECKTMLPFTRHVMERNDIGMEEWMKKHLTKEEYGFWKSQGT